MLQPDEIFYPVELPERLYLLPYIRIEDKRYFILSDENHLYSFECYDQIPYACALEIIPSLRDQINFILMRFFWQPEREQVSLWQVKDNPREQLILIDLKMDPTQLESIYPEETLLRLIHFN